MANYRAIANGNWDNLAIWQDDSLGAFNASSVLPSAADVVYMNNFTVQANIDIEVDRILSDAITGTTIGGLLAVTANRTIIAHTEIRTATGTTDLIDISGTRLTITITSLNIYARSLNCIELAATNSTLNINGNITGSPNSNTGYGLLVSGTGNTINVVGNQFTGGNTNGFPIRINATGNTLNITGNQNSNHTQNCVVFNTESNANIIGNQTSTSTGVALIFTSGTHTVTILGNQQGSNNNITGRAVAGIATTTMTIIGNCYAGTAASGISTVGLVNYKGGIYNNGEKSAILAEFLILANTVDTFFVIKENVTSTMATYSHTDSIPQEADVRQGVNYTAGNTGTLIVPSPSNVRKGVPTDNTVGTADLTAQDFLDLLSTSPDPIAERLRNVSTVQSTGDQIASL